MQIDPYTRQNGNVSILVVLDVVLKVCTNGRFAAKICVSILVVLDVVLKAPWSVAPGVPV